MPPLPALKARLRPLGALLRSVYSRRRQEVFDFDLSGQLPDFRAKVPVVFRHADAADVEAYTGDPDHEMGPSASRLHRRLIEERALPMVGRLDGRIVYHGWAATHRWRVAGSVVVPLGRGKAVMFRGFTVRALRSQGLHAAALSYELRFLKERGVRRAYLNVEETNAPALRAVDKTGFRHVGGYVVVRMAGTVRVLMDESLRRAVSEDLPG